MTELELLREIADRLGEITLGIGILICMFGFYGYVYLKNDD